MGVPFLPLDFQRHTPHAQLMHVFCWMLLIALPALADWTDRYRSAEELLKQGRPESAIRQLRSALAERPDHPAILNALGRAEFQIGHYRSARKYFDQAAQVASEGRAASMSNSAMASIALGENRRAESLARQALEIGPHHVEVLRVLAQALYRQKRHNEAKVTLQTILEIQSDPVTRSDLATVYRAERKSGIAMELLQQAVAEMTPGQARARMLANLGVMQWESGMRQASEKTLLEALGETKASVGPDHPDTARILGLYGEVLRRTGRKAEAKNAAERVAAIHAASGSRTNEGGFTVDWLDSR